MSVTDGTGPPYASTDVVWRTSSRQHALVLRTEVLNRLSNQSRGLVIRDIDRLELGSDVLVTRSAVGSPDPSEAGAVTLADAGVARMQLAPVDLQYEGSAFESGTNRSLDASRSDSGPEAEPLTDVGITRGGSAHAARRRGGAAITLWLYRPL